MRIAALVVVLGVALSGQTAPSIDGLHWIAGAWEGKIGAASSEEHWIGPKGGAMLGVSRTIAGGRMVAFEFLRIVQRGPDIFYIAQPGGRPATEFKLTRSTDREAVFENPMHDHPKIIHYRLEPDGSLLARIEGDEKGKHVVQDFRFQRGK